MSFSISSPAFRADGSIPTKHTCQGPDLSPALEWRDLPAGTQSLALIVDDPDAPDPKAPRMIWVHWVLYNVPPGATGLAEGTTARNLPPGTREGLNDWKKTGYQGPCPPIGRHRYFHKLYALDAKLGLPPRATKSQVEKAMEGHVKEKAELVGRYQKRGK